MRGAPMVPQEKAAIVRKFFRRSYFRVRNVTRSIAESAQDLVWMQNIKPKDAFHVATALDARAVALETFDEESFKKIGHNRQSDADHTETHSSCAEGFV